MKVDSNFVDYVKICCRSGKGGAGSVHFHRDINTAKGGPDGGNGGRGGHIIVRGNKQLWTLIHLKYRKHVIAEEGENGSSANSSGKEGKDEILEVPLGTVAKDFDTGEVIFEITEDGQEEVLVAGGRGGLGNENFKTSTQQSPRYAQPGEPGKVEWKVLELKILADVGLVGFPNAGKSTLLSVVSAAKPEIADYPFTTLTPNLGIVKYYDYQSFVMADIPGIIEGAHEGKGLGIRFLRHIERNSILLFLVSCQSPDIYEEFKVLLNEVEQFNPELLYKKRILGITKCNTIDEELEKDLEKELKKKLKGHDKIPYIFFSSVSGAKIQELKDLLWQNINS
ncbi:MAG: GTPase ObgE [Sphingobacteriaceae bacterium]|nr:GTPase ObgE [Sphingobacteriaceae bacterium]